MPVRHKPPANEVEADIANAGSAESPKSIGETVRLLREKLGDSLAKGELKGTLADYIKLIQLEKEITEDEPREIVVSWTEPPPGATDRK
ncbi:MAG TPA: hypothetical protein VN841_22755 [Bryobacteraceae bacterium]|nr:hypothetical protein [Bryobacteraceae bacterium]